MFTVLLLTLNVLLLFNFNGVFSFSQQSFEQIKMQPIVLFQSQQNVILKGNFSNLKLISKDCYSENKQKVHETRTMYKII